MRNINEYEEMYLLPSFEEIKVKYRRRHILEIIEKFNPKNILEIGCGNEPLFQWVEDTAFTVVEPGERLFENVEKLVKGRNDIKCIQGFYESEEVQERLDGEYDLIICSSLLHEVEEPQKLLNAIVKQCKDNTIVHINVPNANSMHRLLGLAMNLISDSHAKSNNNVLFQQNTVFDKKILQDMVNEAGLQVIDEGTYFVKPFSHAQMYEMLNRGIIDDEVLDGLDLLAKYMPDYGFEIYVNCRING